MNKKLVLSIVVLLLVIAGYFLAKPFLFQPTQSSVPEYLETVDSNGEATNSISFELGAVLLETDLEVPWDLVFLNNDEYLYSERPGQITYVSESDLVEIYDNATTANTSEGGLLGIVLHPNFTTNNWLYLYETYASTT